MSCFHRERGWRFLFLSIYLSSVLFKVHLPWELRNRVFCKKKKIKKGFYIVLIFSQRNHHKHSIPHVSFMEEKKTGKFETIVSNIQRNVHNLLFVFVGQMIKDIKFKLIEVQIFISICELFVKYRQREHFFLFLPSNVSALEWMDFCPDTSGSFSWSTRMLLMRADFLWGQLSSRKYIAMCSFWI